MDRDEVVRISRLVAFGGLTGEDAAKEYYEKKYTINKLQSKPNNMGQRQIILIN